MNYRLLVASALLGAGPLGAQSALPISDTTLANGLHVIVIESHAVPIVTVELDVRNGAFTEPPDFSGLSHLYEHMFFKANRAIPSQERYMERIRELGGLWNGSTATERVNYYLTVGSDSLRPTLQFMEDAIRYPLFDEGELVRERPVVLGEFDRFDANPYFALQSSLDTLLWTAGYVSRKGNGIGDRAVIGSTPKAKMEAIQARYYVPNNTALILAGDVTPERGFQLAREIFGDWPRGADPFAQPVPNPPALTRSQAVIVEKPVGAVTLQMSWHGPSVDDDPQATYAADVLAQVLSNPASAFQKRMVDSGLTFFSGFSYYTQAHVGPISATAQMAPDRLLEAQRALLEELGKMADSAYFSQEELTRAQQQLGVQEVFARQNVTELAHTVGFWWAVAGLDYYRTYLPNMQRVSRSAMADFIRRYVVGKPYVAGVLAAPAAVAQTGLTADKLLQGEVRP